MRCWVFNNLSQRNSLKYKKKSFCLQFFRRTQFIANKVVTSSTQQKKKISKKNSQSMKKKKSLNKLAKYSKFILIAPLILQFLRLIKKIFKGSKRVGVDIFFCLLSTNYIIYEATTWSKFHKIAHLKISLDALEIEKEFFYVTMHAVLFFHLMS